MASIDQKLGSNGALDAPSAAAAGETLFIRRIAAQLGWVGSSQIASSGSRLVVLVLAARMMRPAQFGEFAFFLSSMLVVASLAELNLGRTLVRFLAVSKSWEDVEAGKKLTAAILQAKLILTVPMLLIGLLVAWQGRPGKWLVFWAVVAGVSTSFGPLLAAIFQVQGRFRLYFFAYSIELVRLVAVVFFGLIGFVSVKSLVFLYVLSPLSLVFLWPATGYRLRELLQPVPRATYEALWGFGKWVFLIALFDSLWQRIDVLMLEALSGPAAVGIYSGVYMFMGVAAVVSTSVTTLIYPKMAEAHGRLGLADLVSQYRRSGTAAAFLGLPCVFGIAALAPGLVRTVIGEAYLPGLLLLPWFCVYGVFLILQMNTGAVFWAVGQPALSLVWSVLLVVSSAIGNLLLIPHWGAGGAAAALAASCVLAAGFSWGGVASCVGAWPDFRQIGQFLIGAGVMYAAVRFIPLPSTGATDLGVRIVLGVLVYCVAIKVLRGTVSAPLADLAEIC